MPRAFNYERAAAALVDALLTNDRAAAEKYGVSRKSIEGWRLRLAEDDVLREFFANKKAEQDRAWANEIPAALASCIDFLRRAANECDPRDPDAVHAVAGALKIMAEVVMVREIVDARLAGDSGD